MFDGGVRRQRAVKTGQGGLFAPSGQGGFELLHGGAAEGVAVGHVGQPVADALRPLFDVGGLLPLVIMFEQNVDIMLRPRQYGGVADVGIPRQYALPGLGVGGLRQQPAQYGALAPLLPAKGVVVAAVLAAHGGIAAPADALLGNGVGNQVDIGLAEVETRAQHR